MIYLIGSLRSPRVPQTARDLRNRGYDVFDDWYAAGPEADDAWQAYEQERGRTYEQALDGYHAWHVFQFDAAYLARAKAVVLVLPAGKSAHLELGFALGNDKPGFVLLEGEPERFDVMYRFADGVTADLDVLDKWLRGVGA